MQTKDDNEFEVEPCNWQAFDVFRRVHTQWRTAGYVGGLAVTGLDYNVVLGILDRMRLPPEEQLNLLDKVQLIEIGYINTVSKQ